MASGRMYGAAPAAARDMRPVGEDPYRQRLPGEEAAGWMTFAGSMMLIIGALNVVYGIAAIGDSKFFVKDVAFVMGNLHLWGWLLVVVGVAQFAGGFGVFAGHQLGRWIGIFSAGGNAILQMLFLPSAPFLALTIFALDVFVLYGLIAFGGRDAATD